MAQGDKFQLAIAYPIMNSNFALQNRATGTFSGAYTSGTTMITNGVTPDQGSNTYNFLDLVFKANDRIQVGSSSDTDTADLNKSESALISSFSSEVPGSDFKQFVLDAALSFDYANADAWSGIGSALAGGWFLNGSGITIDSEADVVVGNFDNYAQQVIIKNTASSLGLRQLLDTSFLEAKTLYRLGFIYKFIDGSDASATPLFQVDIDGTTQDIGTTERLSFTAKTIEHTESSAWSSTPYIDFKMTDPGTVTSASKMTATIDEVFFEHTFGDFADTDKSSSSQRPKRTIIPTSNNGYTNGYYEFDEDPDMGSIKITKKDLFQTLKYANGKTVWFDKSGEGDRVEKYNFGCKFSNVSQSFYDVLLEFQRLQDKGHTVNIHPNISDLPDVLRGRFKVSGSEKNQWDLTLRSFNFEFMET